MTQEQQSLVVEREAVTLDDLRAAGVDIDQDFPGASVEEFRRYPVLSEGGWQIVIKHQPTLTTVSRTSWKPLGPISLTSDGLSIH